MSSNFADLQSKSVLVTGATGMQGGSVARALVGAGASVTALVRDPNSAPAQELKGEGVHLQVGDLDDFSSLLAACSGHDCVFSVQLASSPTNPRAEETQADNLIQAAREAGVQHFVHSSVSGTGWRGTHPGADSGGTDGYWDSKEAVEAAVRIAGFPTWTIVKPAFFMNNFVEPKLSHMFPLLTDGEILVACRLDTPLALLSGEDFGKAVAIAVANPAEFSEAEIELSSEALTFTQIADIYSDLTDSPITAYSCSPEAIEARLGNRSWSGMQLWLDAVGYPARPEHAAAYDVVLDTKLHDWLATHRASTSSSL